MKIKNFIFILLLTYLIFLGMIFINKVHVLVVTSNSMLPEFGYGDVLLAKSQEHYTLNDIISFKAGNSIATHRLVAIYSNNYFETKGDANEFSDLDLKVRQDIVGKVTHIIPKVGYLVFFVKSKLMRLLLVGFLITYLAYISFVKVQKFILKYEN